MDCHINHKLPYLDDVKCFIDRSFGVKRESGIDFGGHLAGNNLEDLLAKLDQ